MLPRTQPLVNTFFQVFSNSFEHLRRVPVSIGKVRFRWTFPSLKLIPFIHLSHLHKSCGNCTGRTFEMSAEFFSRTARFKHAAKNRFILFGPRLSRVFRRLLPRFVGPTFYKPQNSIQRADNLNLIAAIPLCQHFPCNRINTIRKNCQQLFCTFHLHIDSSVTSKRSGFFRNLPLYDRFSVCAFT